MRIPIKLTSAAILLAFTCKAFAFFWVVEGAASLAMWVGRAVAPWAAQNATLLRFIDLSADIVGGGLTYLYLTDKDAPADSAPNAVVPVVHLIPSEPRKNPDPSKFDDAQAGSIDPTPKASYPLNAGLAPHPSDYAQVVNGGVYANANYKLTYTVTQSNPASDPYCSGSAITPPPGYNIAYTGQLNGACTYIFSKQESLSCPDGYVQSGSQCDLVDITKVKKPSDTPCEIKPRESGGWDLDESNPNCQQLTTVKNVTQSSMRLVADESNFVDVKQKSDGGYTLDGWSGQVHKTVELGPFSESAHGYPITSVTTSSGQNPGSASSGAGSEAGQSSGSPCGAPGQPACSIDDSGFADLASDGDGLISKIEEHDQSLIEKISGVNPADQHGMNWSWIPTIPRVQCEPLTLGLPGKLVNIDWCPKLELIRQVLGWMFYLFTAWALFDMFTGGTTSNGRGRKNG